MRAVATIIVAVCCAPRQRVALSNAAIRLSVSLSVCPMPLAENGAYYGYGQFSDKIYGSSGVGNMGTGGYIVPPSSGLVPLVPPSQRCGSYQNFKQTTLTTRLYKVRTNLYQSCP